MKKIYLSFVVLFMVISAIAKEPIEQKVNKKQQPKLANTYVKAKDWGVEFIAFIVELFLPVWGKYSEGGTTNRDIPLLTGMITFSVLKKIHHN
jgi:hypothetical protein